MFRKLGKYVAMLLALVTPRKPSVPVLAADAPCPVCGWTAGHTLLATRVQQGVGAGGHAVVTLQTTCGRCEARWHRQPAALILGAPANGVMESVWAAEHDKGEKELDAHIKRMLRQVG